MTPGQIALLIRAVGALLLVGALWWFGGEIVDWVRAPVVAELAKAKKANDSLAEDRDRERERADAFAATLAARSRREAKLDAKLDGVLQDLDALKRSDPAAKELLERRLPPGLFRKGPK